MFLLDLLEALFDYGIVRLFFCSAGGADHLADSVLQIAHMEAIWRLVCLSGCLYRRRDIGLCAI